ncbi:MAG: PilZ domain-containing protein [Deltaproteobacteria bacterium]|nr:PilZ domain-containing protein [Deltaproteobacteria bacterium]
MGKNERRLPRKHIIYFSEVHDKSNPLFSAHLVDISKEGIMVITRDMIEANKHFQLEIVLPDEVDGRDKINCRAVSKWSKKDVNPDYYATGFEIEGIDIIDSELIEFLIYEYGFND